MHSAQMTVSVPHVSLLFALAMIAGLVVMVVVVVMVGASPPNPHPVPLAQVGAVWGMPHYCGPDPGPDPGPQN